MKNIITKARTAKEYLSESVIWTYFSQCTEAVLHMHQNRIIHRDIKPSNILIMSNGTLKLGDLGLGRYLGYESLLAFSQVGTPLYMSPEVLRGEGESQTNGAEDSVCVLLLPSVFTYRALFTPPLRAQDTTSVATFGAWAACCTRSPCCARRSSRRA